MDEEQWYVNSKKDNRSFYKKNKLQPKYTLFASEHLPQGRIVRIDRDKIYLYYQKEVRRCTLKKRMFLEKNNETSLLCVGDLVRFDAESNRIVSKSPRTSFLKRKEHLRGKEDQVLVSNVDTVCITSSLASPYLKPSLIDRAIISCIKGNLSPIVIINKMDLYKEHEQTHELFHTVQSNLAKRNIPLFICSAKEKTGLEPLRHFLKHHCCFFTGHSGVGKTSLINALFSFDFAVRPVSKNNKGTHTTTYSQLIPLDHDVFIVDAPGIKSFGLSDISTSDILKHFNPAFNQQYSCRFKNCTHQTEPDCQVRMALEKEEICPFMYRSFSNLLKETFC